MSYKALAKSKALVQVCPIEISWMFEVHEEEDGNLYISDVHVVDQDCTPATTVMRSDGLARLMSTMEDPTTLNGWGHSHVNMKTFWSGTDSNTIKEFTEHNDKKFISIVFNKRGEYHANLYIPNVGYFDDVKFEMEDTSFVVNEAFAMAIGDASDDADGDGRISISDLKMYLKNFWEDAKDSASPARLLQSYVQSFEAWANTEYKRKVCSTRAVKKDSSTVKGSQASQWLLLGSEVLEPHSDYHSQKWEWED